MLTHVTEASGGRFPSRRACAVLAALLAFQLVLPLPERNLEASASWINLASSLDEAKKLSDVIVVGRVVRTESADDIVVPARGEPNDVDRVGAEAVTVTVDQTYKGNPPGSIQLFHTKLESGADSPVPLPASATRPVNRATPAAPTETEPRRVLLDGDPPYEAGEQYVLFLTAGPLLKRNGVDVPTLAVIAPEGRYLISPLLNDRNNSRLRSMTKRGLAPEYDGRPPSDLLTALGTPIATGPTPKPKNQRGRTNTLVGAAIGAAVIGGLLAGGGKKAPNNENGTAATTEGGTANATTTTYSSRGSGSVGIPQDLSPGSMSSDPADIPKFNVLDITLSWRPPASSSGFTYIVAVLPYVGKATKYATSETQKTVHLDVGKYSWSVRAIDASGRRGQYAPYRFFAIYSNAAPSGLK